jgi:hypothetical protein
MAPATDKITVSWLPVLLSGFVSSANLNSANGNLESLLSPDGRDLDARSALLAAAWLGSAAEHA